MCSLGNALVLVVRIYEAILIVYAILSWIPDLRGRWVGYLAALVEPVLSPLRRIIPPVGGLDLSFIVLLLLINFLVMPLIRGIAINACFAL
jgi:YggT family protein